MFRWLSTIWSPRHRLDTTPQPSNPSKWPCSHLVQCPYKYPFPLPPPANRCRHLLRHLESIPVTASCTPLQASTTTAQGTLLCTNWLNPLPPTPPHLLRTRFLSACPTACPPRLHQPSLPASNCNPAGSLHYQSRSTIPALPLTHT